MSGIVGSGTGGRSQADGHRLEKGGLLVLYLFTAIAVLGYQVYGLNPARLPQTELALRIYSLSFESFARLHILIAAIVLFAVLIRRLGFRWVPAFLTICALAFMAEHIGTGYGVPFGGYSYTGLLGMKIGGRVPLLIPISWFLMALPAWVLARSGLPRRGQRLGRVALGALWLVAWDLALDPAMSFLTPYWRWEEVGSYYGMPWINLAGWYVTGLLLMTALDALAERSGWDRLSPTWMGGYYLAILLMPIGMLLAAGVWGAAITTALGVGVCAVLTRACRFADVPASNAVRIPAGAAEV